MSPDRLRDNVSSGGIAVVSGTASGTTVVTGGAEVISARGQRQPSHRAAPSLKSGVASRAGGVSFAGGGEGELELEELRAFPRHDRRFSAPDVLDLRDIPLLPAPRTPPGRKALRAAP
jgi:hypothetical protein